MIYGPKSDSTDKSPIISSNTFIQETRDLITAMANRAQSVGQGRTTLGLMSYKEV